MAPFVSDGGGPVLSARVAEECYWVMGQELSGEEERLHEDLASQAKERELVAWK